MFALVNIINIMSTLLVLCTARTYLSHNIFNTKDAQGFYRPKYMQITARRIERKVFKKSLEFDGEIFKNRWKFRNKKYSITTVSRYF